MKTLLHILFAIVLLFSGCSTPSTTITRTIPAPVPEPQIPTYFATYTDEATFFSISYPSGWTPLPSWLEATGMISKNFFKSYDPASFSATLPFVFVAEAPKESDVSPASVNVVVQALSDMTIRGQRTLDEIVEAKVQRTKETHKEYYEFSRTKTIINGSEAVIIDWESYTSDLSGRVRSIQMYTVVDKLVWKVTGYADSNRFSEFDSDLLAIVRSLRILK